MRSPTICVVVDLERGTERRPCVVGCYRVLREIGGPRGGGFYTAHEFDLSAVSAAPTARSWNSVAPASSRSTAPVP